MALVHHEAFSRQTMSEKWIVCNFQAFPRIRQFVALLEGEVIGYIQWVEKSGFRKEAVLELEQIAVQASRRGQGVGTALIQQSLAMIQEALALRGSTLKHVLVTTRSDNQAQRLYAKVLGAQVEATLSNLFSADEVVMVARGSIGWVSASSLVGKPFKISDLISI